MEKDNSTENVVKIMEEDITENVVIPEKKVIESDVKAIHQQTNPKADQDIRKLNICEEFSCFWYYFCTYFYFS